MKVIKNKNGVTSSIKEINGTEYVNTNQEKSLMELDEKTREKLNIGMVATLFEAIYKQSIITKKEYDSLILNLCRTYHIKK